MPKVPLRIAGPADDASNAFVLATAEGRGHEARR
jgi:hypothetical protein